MADHDAGISSWYTVHEGRRCVRPYTYTFTSYAKRRWVGQRVLTVLEREFPDRCGGGAAETDGATGRLRLNGSAVTPESVFRDGDRLQHDVMREEPSIPHHPVTQLSCAQPDMLAVLKPAGVPVHHAGRFCRNTMVEILQIERPDLLRDSQCGRREGLHVLHRLDRGVSGVLLLPRTKEACSLYAALLEARCFTKLYVARVVGKPAFCSDAVDTPILTVSDAGSTRHMCHASGRPSKTLIAYIAHDTCSRTSLVLCRPLTGRPHQIRLHLAHIGHPIANDSAYLYAGSAAAEPVVRCHVKPELVGGSANDVEEIWLHAWRYKCSHAARPFCVEAPLPSWALLFAPTKVGLSKALHDRAIQFESAMAKAADDRDGSDARAAAQTQADGQASEGGQLTARGPKAMPQLPSEVILRATLNRLRTGDTCTACRECGIEQPATTAHYHPKQLKEWAKRGCQSPRPLCTACAARTKDHELCTPIGFLLHPRTGAPLIQRDASSAARLVRTARYDNAHLTFPYDAGATPAIWVTDSHSFFQIVQSTSKCSPAPLRYYPNFLTEEEAQRVMDVLDAEGGARWCKVFRRRQQYYGETYYHTAQQEAAVQPVLNADGSSEPGAVVPHDMAPLKFVIDKFFDRCFHGAALDESDGSLDRPTDANGLLCVHSCHAARPLPASHHIFGTDRRNFPTQILVNEYKHDFGISSHFEDETAFGDVIATISLLAPVYMSLERPTEHDNACQRLEAATKVLLEPRSLFVMAGCCRYEWRHGITRQARLTVPQGCAGSLAEANAPTQNKSTHPQVNVSTVRRDSSYRRVSLTIRHLLPGRKQVVASTPA